MRMLRLVPLLALYLSAAQGQNSTTVQRVLQFAQSDTPQTIEESANALRVIGGIRQVSVDATARTATVQATAPQADLAEWLVHALEGASPAMQEYVVPGGADDLVRVFHTLSAWTPQQLQETMNSFRTLAGMQRTVFTSASSSLAVRGAGWEVKLSQWLVQERGPETAAAAGDAYTIPGVDYGAVRVFRPANAVSPQALQEIINAIRSIVGVQRILSIINPAQIIARGEPDEIQFAEWLVQHLDSPPPGQPSVTYQTDRTVGMGLGAVRIFYLAPETTPASMIELVNRIRTDAQIQRTVGYSAGKAIVLRGTDPQVAVAEAVVAAARAH